MSIVQKFKRGDEFYVMRFSKHGDVRLSKPCNTCQYYLREHGVPHVWYTTNDGSWTKLNLKD